MGTVNYHVQGTIYHLDTTPHESDNLHHDCHDNRVVILLFARKMNHGSGSPTFAINSCDGVVTLNEPDDS